MIKDFMQGSIGMDVCAVCVGFVYDLSSEVSKHYKRVIFGEMGDVQNGRSDGEVMWVQGVGGDAGEQLPSQECLRTVVKPVC